VLETAAMHADAGFYCADTVSLSFGALSVNDVVAAAVTVAFCEVVSYVYYQARDQCAQSLALTLTFTLTLAHPDSASTASVILYEPWRVAAGGQVQRVVDVQHRRPCQHGYASPIVATHAERDNKDDAAITNG